ncbi:MAG TPA: hypothetical protein VKX16_07720 [Chloroflexota bacterium]|nr:hypothetical protein [Chloroflexota bacterium]
MEDWQEWQIRADQIAADLGAEIDKLDSDFFGENPPQGGFRSFWPRFRDLKERVRTAPAIKLDDKLNLERRLRSLGGRAYKGQEAMFARSAERKDELLASVADLKRTAESEGSPRTLRMMRRDFEGLRGTFDEGPALSPADRQLVWDAWREANQYTWQKLVGIWNENETSLREVLGAARQQLSKGNAAAARQSAGRFFELLKSRETKQEVVAQLKAEAEEIRREADELESRRTMPRNTGPTLSPGASVDGWRAEVARNQESIDRLRDEVSELDRQVQEASSILEQAMLRGTLVDKRRKLAELERSSRTLLQRIEQSEDSPLVSAG